MKNIYVGACFAIFTMIPGLARCADTQPTATTRSVSAVATELDRLLGTATAQSADNVTLLRRMSFDLTGRPPAASDVRDLAFENGPEAIARASEQMIASSDFADSFARYWRNAILSDRSSNRVNLAAGPLEDYVRQSVENSVGWDLIVRGFMTAQGSVADDGRTAVIFAAEGKPEDVAADMSRLFLGIQIQCAQCHDHPTDVWTRQQFHQLAAYFSRVAIRPDRSGDRRDFIVSVNDSPFAPRGQNDNRYVGQPEHRMPDLEHPDRDGEVMTPTFFVSTNNVELGTMDRVRRATIAAELTSADNVWFSRAIVNRMWTHYVGGGFYDAVDGLGSKYEAQQPAALELLCNEFVASGFDIKWLASVITATRAYRQVAASASSDTNPGPSVAVVRRLSGDEMYESLSAVIGAQSFGQLIGGRAMNREPAAMAGVGMSGMGDSYAGVLPRLFFATAADLEGTTTEASVPGVLMLMNGPLVSRTLASPISLPSTTSRRYVDDARRVDAIYLKTLSRLPTPEQRDAALESIADSDTAVQGLEDVMWSLICGTEFGVRQ